MNKNLIRLRSCLQCLTTKPTATNRSLTSKANKENEKESVKMDQMKANPYFEKYQAKLKAVYK